MTTKELIEKIKEIDPDGIFTVHYFNGAMLDRDGLPGIPSPATDIVAAATGDNQPAKIIIV